MPSDAYAASVRCASVSGRSTRPPSTARVEAASSRISTSLTDRRDRRAQHGYNCIPLKLLGKIQPEPNYLLPGVTPLECASRPMAYFPPLIQPSQFLLISLACKQATLSFLSSIARCSSYTSFKPSCLFASFARHSFFQLLRFNRAHLHFSLVCGLHSLFIAPNPASTASIIPCFESAFGCTVTSITSVHFSSAAIRIQASLENFSLHKQYFILFGFLVRYCDTGHP